MFVSGRMTLPLRTHSAMPLTKFCGVLEALLSVISPVSSFNHTRSEKVPPTSVASLCAIVDVRD